MSVERFRCNTAWSTGRRQRWQLPRAGADEPGSAEVETVDDNGLRRRWLRCLCVIRQNPFGEWSNRYITVQAYRDQCSRISRARKAGA